MIPASTRSNQNSTFPKKPNPRLQIVLSLNKKENHYTTFFVKPNLIYMRVSTIFSIQEINQQVKRILDYTLFKNSPVLSRFLEFVVDETLHKNELQIKEYAIAIHVLYRSRDFNPNGDSIVRIHAGRLRRALTDYYLTEGMYDPIIIQIPKGRYIPEFSGSGTVKQMSDQPPVLLGKDHKPLVAIFPLRVPTLREHM